MAQSHVIDGIHYWTREELESDGFSYTGHTVDQWTVAGMYRLQREMNLADGSVMAFRVDSGQWEYYLTPEAKPGFIDRPLLPP